MLAFLALSSVIITAQQDFISWEKFSYLKGNWKGEGEGKPVQGEGTFSFNLDLEKNILVRKSHSEYPASENKPKIVHDDLMIISHDNNSSPNKAIYFDNEGHVINYSVTFPNEKDLVFTSEKIQGMPIFRLTYNKISENLVNIKFEMSQDDEKFMTYVEGKSKKID